VETLHHALRLKRRWLARATLGLVLGGACAPAVQNRQQASSDGDIEPGQNAITFRNPELAERYKKAKADPKNFEVVFAYVKPVTDSCMASLADKPCEGCGEGAVRYRHRSELAPNLWPIIEDALSMLETLGAASGLTAEQSDRLVATKGRLLWLAGRSNEELTLLENYALSHPTAAPVIRRRLDLLREADDYGSMESQCARSRAKMGKAPVAVRIDILTACVALHPENTQGRSDLLDYAKYLPNLTDAEDDLYRTYLVQRCVEKVGTDETRCAESCACEKKDSGKQPDAKCKRTCSSCRSETAQKQGLCKKLGEAPPAPAPTAARVSRRKGAPAAAPKSAPAKSATKGRQKAPASDAGLQKAEL
jgi:hypothetical protein